MKRAFSQFSSVLLKKYENEDLRSTLKFLSQNSKKPILSNTIKSSSSSSLNLENNKRNKTTTKYSQSIDPAANKHVEIILNVLNSSLPDPKRNMNRVNTHYDILFNQLQELISKSIKGATNSSMKCNNNMDNIHKLNSEELFNKLVFLQYTNELQINDILQILLNKKFHHYKELLGIISIFPRSIKMEMTILLYYKTKLEEIKSTYGNDWLESFEVLHPSIKRIFWKCQNNYNSVMNTINNVELNSKDYIILYQSLYNDAFKLPDILTYNSANDKVLLTKNQKLFIQSLRIISMHQSKNKTNDKEWLIKIVKLSLETKLLQESMVPSELKTFSIYQYKFLRSLDITLQNYSRSLSNTASSNNSETIRAVEDLLKEINNEEQEIKTQMSLRYI
ncbi:Smt1p NDAI_0G06300 [Naumovozyma dairenensis CBS 421]|uniref:Uncharacterized protein n=1 Tax=Naumovozyma dairenensis (strain ATCC 10597 / BCRC 20456 / CBS 421 / NBRC 0211 / NRRL Y-12639) TaxID=1071378 RepID=J7SB76_NAUDC|nr:hypothetical protein NDAI_0G06300 [Naumovozyma dairenensis CBS 421]CCK73613.1 hypothetical protein NDAI_0G06300 [Naumovozyma dairenensis CBS 421]